MGRTVQGVLNLYDNDDEDGGFQCVPGLFGSALQTWVSKHPALPKPEPNGRYDLRNFGVYMEIAKSRAILFLRYITSDELPSAAWGNRNAALKQMVEKVGFEPTAQQ